MIATFPYRLKNDALDAQVKSHADCITCNKKVVFIVRIVEQGCLLSTYLGKQATINDCNSPSCFNLDLLLHGMDPENGEGYNAIPFPKIFEVATQTFRHRL